MSDWLTIAEALRRSGLSRATLYRLIADGKLRRAKRAGDIRAYVSARDLKRVTTLRETPPRRSASPGNAPEETGLSPKEG